MTPEQLKSAVEVATAEHIRKLFATLCVNLASRTADAEDNFRSGIGLTRRAHKLAIEAIEASVPKEAEGIGWV